MSGSQDMTNLGLSVSTAIRFNKKDTSLINEDKKEAIKAWNEQSRQMNVLLDHFNSSVTTIYKSDNQQLLDDLTAFIRSHPKGKLGYIPAAQIRLGMNVADNGLVADMIENHVTKQRVALSVVRLTNQDCLSFSDIKVKIAESIMTPEISEIFFDGGCGDVSEFQDLSYSRLALMRNRFIKDKRPTVVIIDDLESCSTKSGLDSFIVTAREHIQELNLVMIFCCYTGCFTIQQLLPSVSSDSLYLSSFSPKIPRNLFEAVMSKVMLTPDLFSFKLSPSILRLIVDNFVFIDISLSQVTFIIKTCLFRHFNANRLSEFASLTIEDFSEKLESMDKKVYTKLMKEVSKLPSVKNIKIISKDCIKSCLVDIHSSHQSLVDVCTYLYLLTKNISGSRIPSTLTGMFISFLGCENFSQSPEVEEAIQLFGFLSPEEFNEKLELCCNNASRIEPSPIGLTLMKEFEVLKSFVEEEEAVTKLRQSLPQIDVDSYKTRSEWKEKMKKRIAETPKVLSKFEVWRNNFMVKMRKVLQEVSSPYFLPLNELVYFDDHEYIVDHCFPSIRSQIVQDLRDPLHTEEDNDFDISRVYNLVEESGNKIDFHELLESFVNNIPTKKRKGKVEEDKSRNGILVSSLNDLEFIGIVQRDKRRPDILTKVTWE